MEAMQHQMMGYDRTSTMFSPDGRLLQVEYAKKTVKQGTTTIGMVCKDGVVLIADKRIIEEFIVSESVEKVIQIDEHIGATSSGILSDGRILMERAQLIAQQHRVNYDEPITVKSLVKDIADLKQAFTQYGGARPFGVSILFAGVDDEPVLFMTDVTGIYFQYRLAVIGEAEVEVKEILSKEYKPTMNVEDGIALAIRALKKVLGKEFDISRIDGAVIRADTKKFEKIENGELKKILR